MLVAGQDDDIVEPAHPRQQAAARHLIAGPAVEIEQFAPARLGLPAAVERHHHHLLGDDVPARVAAGEVARQPGFLLGAEHRARWGRVTPGQAGLIAVAARLVGAELAGVEEVERGEIAVAGAAIELEMAAPCGNCAPAHRHMLVPGLEGGGAAQAEDLGRRVIVVVDVAGPIVA